MIVGIPIRSFALGLVRTRCRNRCSIPTCAHMRPGRGDKKSPATAEPLRGIPRRARTSNFFGRFSVQPRRLPHFARVPEFRMALHPTFRPLLKGARNICFGAPPVNRKRKIPTQRCSALATCCSKYENGRFRRSGRCRFCGSKSPIWRGDDRRSHAWAFRRRIRWPNR